MTRIRTIAAILFSSFAMLALTGCPHHHRDHQPPPPPIDHQHDHDNGGQH
jgi:hypothetical protein